MSPECAADAPPESLVGRRIGTIALAAYVRRETLPSGGGAPDLTALDWIGPDEGMLYRDLDRWMAAEGHDARCRYRVDSVLGMLAALRHGAEAAVLPCYLGDAEPALARASGIIPALSIDLWLLTHPDLRRTARVRAVLDHVAEAVGSMRDRLGGIGS